MLSDQVQIAKDTCQIAPAIREPDAESWYKLKSLQFELHAVLFRIYHEPPRLNVVSFYSVDLVFIK